MTSTSLAKPYGDLTQRTTGFPPLTTRFIMPPDCATRPLLTRRHQNQLQALGDSEFVRAVVEIARNDMNYASSCYPSGFVSAPYIIDVGNSNFVELYWAYSPGACPPNWYTATQFLIDSSRTLAECCRRYVHIPLYIRGLPIDIRS